MFLVSFFHISRCYHHSRSGFGFRILSNITQTCARLQQLITFYTEMWCLSFHIISTDDFEIRENERKNNETHKNSCRSKRNVRGKRSFKIPVSKEQLEMDTSESLSLLSILYFNWQWLRAAFFPFQNGSIIAFSLRFFFHSVDGAQCVNYSTIFKNPTWYGWNVVLCEHDHSPFPLFLLDLCVNFIQTINFHEKPNNKKK